MLINQEIEDMNLNVYNTEFALKIPQDSLTFFTYMETVITGIIFAVFIYYIISVFFLFLDTVCQRLRISNNNKITLLLNKSDFCFKRFRTIWGLFIIYTISTMM